MATLYNVPVRKEPKFYRDYFSSLEDQVDALKESTTVYVGNLDFVTTEERIFTTFSSCGPVDKIVMGINRYTLAPCGFCFVIFFSHEAAQNAVDFLSGLRIDGRVIRVEMDWGFSDGRQYGRAKDGNQMRHYINNIKSQGKGDGRRMDHRPSHEYRKREREDYSYHHSNHRRGNYDSYGSDDKRRRSY